MEDEDVGVDGGRSWWCVLLRGVILRNVFLNNVKYFIHCGVFLY